MAPSDPHPVRGSNETSKAAVDDKQYIADAAHIERMETNDNDLSLAKVAAEAKLDEFGARSKTNPEEIALVKKLDRTILVGVLELET